VLYASPPPKVDPNDTKTPEVRKQGRREKFLREFEQTEEEFERLLELTIQLFIGNLDCQRFIRLYFGHQAEVLRFPRIAHQLNLRIPGADQVRLQVFSRMREVRALELYQRAAKELKRSPMLFDEDVYKRAKGYLKQSSPEIAKALRRIHSSI
jgi:hypothetical protein